MFKTTDLGVFIKFAIRTSMALYKRDIQHFVQAVVI